MSTQLASVPPGYDIPTRALAVVHAARHLVDFRDGLAGALLDMAEVTAEQDCPAAATRIARLLTALGHDEAWRRASQIAHLGTPCWGYFREVPERRENALATLRAVCQDTATAVRDALHRNSCVCNSADLQKSLTREPHYEAAGGGQL